jgi:hypothetical protein
MAGVNPLTAGQAASQTPGRRRAPRGTAAGERVIMDGTSTAPMESAMPTTTSTAGRADDRSAGPLRPDCRRASNALRDGPASLARAGR